MAWLKQCDVLVAEVTTPSLGVGYVAILWGLYMPCNTFQAAAILSATVIHV